MHILVSDDRIVCIGPFNSEEEATTHLSQEMGYVPGAGYWERADKNIDYHHFYIRRLHPTSKY
ncbi:MAG: hypothetical protein UV75_C0002G0158 [Candidatus Giovannonibacteria bacterium GW2011_GWA1_43_15]|uniref:Uncharacterized protein n=1 Tax=Candidatus Giovannonibacteria bacterium GW2011_GWA2_44_26 TaxID=1618648 RepID=A0A0G1L5H4_9BACT|nr:MAG: hypothetical protein UV72_C0001G0020 [Candidatus Giovannonibacteria bacterium GW2011_GWB1_43_13]KKS99777.1 MAG: hypothetical protein UV75_C0002G0158 [Candidatus Giovannonibacteria bacterium GW2011_GWA1_43_15]KKT63862.1 MAG: hypothetical protein UW55_C0001G0155 [Candidatus Giovannonibacteria bacterium GW2011_GWA2_44_26]